MPEYDRLAMVTASDREPATRLARKLGVGDAVFIGLGAMIGAGIFAAPAPAAAVAGSGLLAGLVIAGVVAYCNAASSASLAALYPESGGAYVYGRKRLGPFPGFIAGFAFVTGKIASCAAMALTFGAYAAPTLARPLAVAAVTVLTAINYFGVSKTLFVTRIVVGVVLACLAVVVLAGAFGGTADVARLAPSTWKGVRGVLESAGFLFFAFAGYARIATLGEEVIDPARTIPRAIRFALLLTLVVYAVVCVTALVAVDAPSLASTSAPLVQIVAGGGLAALAPIVRAGAAVASLGALLSLLAGVSRTAFAMAGNGDLPKRLACVHPRYRVPDRAELVVGALVVIVVLATDARAAIGASSFAVLVYYGIANAAALTLREGEQRFLTATAIVGVAGCALLAAMLPRDAIIVAGAVLAAGATLYAARRVAAR